MVDSPIVGMLMILGSLVFIVGQFGINVCNEIATATDNTQINNNEVVDQVENVSEDSGVVVFYNSNCQI